MQIADDQETALVARPASGDDTRKLETARTISSSGSMTNFLVASLVRLSLAVGMFGRSFVVRHCGLALFSWLCR